jgi:hypothetical protein
MVLVLKANYGTRRWQPILKQGGGTKDLEVSWMGQASRFKHFSLPKNQGNKHFHYCNFAKIGVFAAATILGSSVATQTCGTAEREADGLISVSRPSEQTRLLCYAKGRLFD